MKLRVSVFHSVPNARVSHTMRKLDFYGLPRSLQDRFIESIRSAAVPLPVTVLPAPDRRSAKAGAVAALVLSAWALFTAHGFGRLESASAVGGPVQVAVHLVFAAAAVTMILRAYGLSWEAGRALIGQGVYVFPGVVLVVQGTQLTEYAAADIEAVRAEGPNLVLAVREGVVFRFPFSDRERLEEAALSLEKSLAQFKELSEADAIERARSHPLVDSGLPNPLAPTEAHRRPVWLGPLLIAVLVVAVGGGLGLGVSRVRNSLSEKKLFREAVAQNTVSAYEAYLARGGRRADVLDLYLPRAKLQLAVRAGSVEAIEKFLAENPNTKIRGEVVVIQREALLVELAKAKAQGGLSAIEALRQRFPAHHLIEPELKAARREAFVLAAQNFEAGAAEKLEGILPFVRDLLAYTEVHGKEVHVRWAHDFSQSREMLDNIVSKSEKYYLGRKSLPTQYFLGDYAARREDKLAQELIERIGQAFPADVVSFVYDGPSGEPNRVLGEVTVPTLSLIHKESLSGGFVGGKPKGMYLGASVTLTARFELPGRPEPFKFRWDAWRAPDFSVLVDKDIPEVYEYMMGGAFDGFRNVYLKQWFKEP